MNIKSDNPAYSFDNAFCHGPAAKGFEIDGKLIIVNVDGEEVAVYPVADVKSRLQCRIDVTAYQLDPVRVVALVLEEEIKAMHHSNKFIGDAQDNMQVCRYKVNEVLKEYGYKDLMIKRDEKFRYRNDLANRIFEIYESL
ncbi:hypothetical protein ECP32DNA_00152 [Escherichia phage vB_EcoM-ECP32]|jgi:hypothetical protein|uniref:Uncharacterized protein n=2 Tax=Vequintavirus TaxID=1914852 RepID=A0A4Y5TW20_9CAUD|nr:hypothetical protein ECP26DNA_00182 [Escherichia phage vB_EcoM-ECP26]QDB73777.1 hypothetical protein ECP32DNA_00152 [Escherichia phage vB_EcoM-ECP32]